MIRNIPFSFCISLLCGFNIQAFAQTSLMTGLNTETCQVIKPSSTNDWINKSSTFSDFATNAACDGVRLKRSVYRLCDGMAGYQITANLPENDKLPYHASICAMYPFVRLAIHHDAHTTELANQSLWQSANKQNTNKQTANKQSASPNNLLQDNVVLGAFYPGVLWRLNSQQQPYAIVLYMNHVLADPNALKDPNANPISRNEWWVVKLSTHDSCLLGTIIDNEPSAAQQAISLADQAPALTCSAQP